MMEPITAELGKVASSAWYIHGTTCGCNKFGLCGIMGGPVSFARTKGTSSRKCIGKHNHPYLLLPHPTGM
jgi:hypothetical protein